jgi:SdpC family antimicrobial peptide
MKLLKKHVCKIALTLSLSLLFASCSQYEANGSVKETSAQYTDVELFNSIFFGVGEFATNINQLKSKVQLTDNLKNDKRAEVLSKLDILINEINRKNPGFLSEFKTLITSGDQRKVQIAIEAGSTMIKENFEVIFPELKQVFQKVKSDIHTGKFKLSQKDSFKTYMETFQSALEKGEYNSLLKKNMITEEGEEYVVPCTWAVACVAYFAIAAHNTVAVTALIYFKFAFYGPSIDSGSQVSYDGAIDYGLDYTGMDYIGPDEINPGPIFIDPDEANLRTESLINEIAEYYAD